VRKLHSKKKSFDGFEGEHSNLCNYPNELQLAHLMILAKVLWQLMMMMRKKRWRTMILLKAAELVQLHLPEQILPPKNENNTIELQRDSYELIQRSFQSFIELPRKSNSYLRILP